MAKPKIISDIKEANTKKFTKEYILENLAFWIMSFLAIIVPLFFLPFESSDFLFSKTALFTSTTLIALSLAVFSTIKKGGIHFPKWQYLVLFFLVPILTLVSSFLSINPASSFIGVGSEFDTAHFVSLGFILILLVAAHFQSKQKVFLTYIGIIGVFAFISLFHIVRFLFGSSAITLGGLFSSVVSNTVGTWNDLGTYAGFIVIITFITIEFADLKKRMSWFFYGALALGLLLLLGTNFYVINGSGFVVPLTAIIGAIALFVFVYLLNHSYKNHKRLPVASLIVLVFCVVTTIGASSIATFVNQKIGITQNDIVDVRLTLSGTYGIAEKLITQGGVTRAIIGVGPNRFSTAWALFRPASVNQTVFWNTDFNYGTGYVLSTIVTLGILGFVAWLAFLLTLFWKGAGSIFASEKDKFSLYILATALFTSLYLWLIAFFSIPSTSILVLTFFSTGLLIAALIREEVLKLYKIDWTTSQKKGTFVVVALIVVFIGAVVWAFVWSQKYIASVEIRKATIVLKGPENIAQAQDLIAGALQYAPNVDVYFRALSQLKLLELQLLFQKVGKSELTPDSKNILAQGVAAAEEAVRVNPRDYRNLIFLGQTYQTAGLLGIEGAGDAALNAYKEAAAYIPSSPLPSYFAGYLFSLAKDSKNAETLLQQSLQLKPDFQEAYTLYNQLQQANPKAQSTVSDDVQISSSPARDEEKAVSKEKATSTATTSSKTKR